MPRDPAVCCPGRAVMSLDSMPPYVYCTGCGKAIPCPRCGAPTGGDCYPECQPKQEKEPDDAA